MGLSLSGSLSLLTPVRTRSITGLAALLEAGDLTIVGVISPDNRTVQVMAVDRLIEVQSVDRTIEMEGS